MRNFLFILLISLPALSSAQDILERFNKRTFDISVRTRVEHWGIGKSQTNLFLAYLGTNEYQKGKRAELDSLAKLTHLGSNGDKCIYYDVPLGRKESFGKQVVMKDHFSLETFDICTNFDAIGKLHAYDTTTQDYKRYTASNLPFINKKHPVLVGIGDHLWQESEDIIDYARQCYLFVAENFHYGNPETGFKTMDYMLRTKTGDCGNLATVFISLLRLKGIPARHLMGFRPDGSVHVWADFYLQDYGWIPVDVTYKNEYPEEDYFGNIKFEESGFIVQRGIAHEVSVLPTRKRVTGLQTYKYEVLYSKPMRAKVYIDRKVVCKEVTPSSYQ